MLEDTQEEALLCYVIEKKERVGVGGGICINNFVDVF